MARRSVRIGIVMSMVYIIMDMERTKLALLNTVLGMGIVFAVLILISFIIYLLGMFIRAVQHQQVHKLDEVDSRNNVDENIEYIESCKEELSDDKELVAVITAAILFSLGENAPNDGLIVRSIRRKNKGMSK